MNGEDRRYILRNGIEIPALGFGTFRIPDGEEVYTAVSAALETGYRHIDTAEFYGNEAGIGRAVRDSGVPREEIFITSKVWNDRQGYKTTLQAFEETLERLGTDYLDLYLIHWFTDKSPETWKAFESIYDSGRARAIGVCNFTPAHLDHLEATASIIPMVNQVELHPQFPQYELQEYCLQRHIQIEAWAPLMQGKIFDIPLVQDIADSYGCSVAHLAIVWQFQQENVALVKSSNPERIRDNFEVPDISLSLEDLERLAELEGDRISKHPDSFH